MGFLKTFENWVVCEKVDWISKIKNLSFSHIPKRWQNCCRMRIKWLYSLTRSSTLFIYFFAKDQKSLKVGKQRNYDEERVFLSIEKTFSPFWKLSLKRWEGAKHIGGSWKSVVYKTKYDTSRARRTFFTSLKRDTKFFKKKMRTLQLIKHYTISMCLHRNKKFVFVKKFSFR